MTPTVKDIAARAGVSYSMIPRALNDSGPVTPERKRRILEIAETMDYVPNHTAVFLREPNSHMIGLCLSTISKSSSPYVLHDVLTGVCSVPGGSYHVIIRGIDIHISGSLNPSQYDGILVMSQWDSGIEFLEGAYRKSISMVVVNRQLPIDIPSVAADETGGTAQAMEHLLKCGRHRIGIIERSPNLEATVLRHTDWWTTAKQRGLSPEEMPMEYNNYRYHSGETVAGQLLKAHPRLTTLLCFGDKIAFGAKNAAEELGLRIPDDLSLIGFNNLVYSSYSDLRLTTVERGATTVAVEGTKILLQSTSEGDFRLGDTWLEIRPIMRDSVKGIWLVGEIKGL